MSASGLSLARRSGRVVATVTAASLLGIGLTAVPAFADPTEPEVVETTEATETATEEASTEAPAPAEPTAEAAPEAAPEVAPEASAADVTVQRMVTDGPVFISEIHYDNVGTDVGEAIEVQAPVGTDLTGWSILLYNGGAGTTFGTVYNTSALSGTVGDSGVVVVDYPVNGIQNGDPDGIALVNGSTVVEFLSYEGTFTATSGLAAGIASTDIGVSQNGSPIGQSLQRIDGVWKAPAASSFGTLNSAGPVDPGDPQTVTIAQIQGTGDTSPLLDQTVTTTGVVTAAYPTGNFNGYYIQTAGTGGDTDPSARTASDGIFVYSTATVAQVAIGDYVRVTGKVGEYYGLTQITVAAAGLSILDETVAPVQPITDFVLPGTDAAREPFEGMLVTPADRYVISDTYALGGWGTAAYGSIGLGLDGALVQETDVALPGTGEFDAVAADNAARAVTLDDGQSSTTSTSSVVPYLTGNPDVRTGVGLEFAAPVIVDYRFQWNFQPTAPVTDGGQDVVAFTGGNTQAANATPDDVGGDLVLATFNVLNYFTTLGTDLAGCTPYNDRQGNPITVSGGCDARGAWDATNLQRQQDKIVAAINGLGADVVGLEEIENSAQFGEDRDTALAALVDALNAAAGEGTWAYAPSPAELPALAEQDVIRNAFIYQPASVTLDGDSTVLVGDAAFGNAREPLAQAFASVENPDYSFLAVTNHFKSKGGDCGDLPEGCFDDDRVAQSQSLTAFAQATADAAGVEDIFLVGDFNSYSAENPVVAIENAGYTNLETTEPTYVYDGKVGSMDHLFGNASATARVTGTDVWRINAEDSVLAEYSRWNYFASQYVQLGTQFRASDHNPLIVGIDVPDAEPSGPTTIDLLSINDFHGRIVADGQSAGAAVLACTVDSYREENPNTVFISAGDNIGASTFVSAVANDQPTIDVLNAMGLQVSALGNHEFDKGQADLNDRVLPAVDFPYLAANVYTSTGEHAYEPYTTIDAGGVTIGFIGAVTEELPSLVSPAGIEGLEIGDLTESVNAVAAQLTDGDDTNGEADVLIAIVHDGAATPDLASADGTPYGNLIANIDDSVSAVISGHTHQAYVEQVGDLWVTQSAQYGEQLGHLQIVVDEAGEATVVSAENVDLVPSTGPLCTGDPEIQAIVDEAVANAKVLGAVPVGEITDDFLRAGQADGSENRGGESTIGNFVADVQLWAGDQAGAQIAFMNPGGIRQNLTYAAAGAEGDGVVTYEEAAVVQPFANTLVALDLTGAQIEQVLEQQWQPTGASRPFLKLGISEGFRYVYDPDAPAGERIVAAYLDGELLDANTSYRVIVNSFLASGGDNFLAFAQGTNRSDTGQVDLDAMVRYFEAQDGPVSPDTVQRAVGVDWVSDPAATYAVGDEIAFDLSSLAFSRDEPKPTEVTVTLDGQDVGSYAVDPTIVSTTDEVGRASVAFTVPEGISGEVELSVSDDVNGVTYTTTVTVEETAVDTVKPVATLVAPTTAGPFQTLSLQVDATDNVGLNRIVANIYSGSTLVQSTQTAANGATAATHTATVTLPDGTYTIRYNASDLAGNIAQTGTFTVTIDRTKPVATLVAPTTAGPFQTLSLQVDATDAVGLNRIVANIYSGSTLVRSTQTAANGATAATHTATVTLPDGTYTIRYNASDLAGNIAQTGTFTVTIDRTGPTVTIKTGADFTVGGPAAYQLISFKLYDAGKIDRFVLNGTERDLVNNAWSDINSIKPGQFGAVTGLNTLVVYDVAGNATTVTFTLENAPAPDPWEPWRAFAKWLWSLLQILFPTWPWP